MKKILFLLSFLIQLQITSHAQSLTITPISKETTCDRSIDYLEFSGKENKKLINNLNKKFGYRMTLLKMLAQNDQSKIKEEELEKKFCNILTEKEEDILGTIEYTISYNTNHIVNILETQVPEGLRKFSNSVVSDFPIISSYIYNTKTGKEITELSDFLTKDGINYLTTAVKKNLDERVNRLAIESPKDYECPFSNEQNLSYFLNLNYKISNNYLTIHSPDSILYFYFNENGLIIDSNLSPCWLPTMQVTFPYQEICSFCISDSSSNPIFAITQRINKIYSIPAYIVKNTTSLTEEPTLSHITPVAKPYLVKGDKVKVIGEIKNAVKVKYISPQGKELIGWVFRGDLE